ncbi:MAG: glycosyltransferase [Ignavibacteriaceae bacterium]|nr:glycosyltransferase [Ignavibacteriaceae bacterium]
MYFSLIISTIDRTKELQLLFDSLIISEFTGFEIIVVDQNGTPIIDQIITDYSNQLNIKHIKSTDTGLSKGRNLGILNASGEVFCFPDDDSVYPPSLLREVFNCFGKKNIYQGVSVKCRAIEDNSDFGRWSNSPTEVNRKNCLTTTMSTGLFLKKTAVLDTGFFDENLGAGAQSPYLSGEETDFVLRFLQKGHRLFYNPELFVFHPKKVINYSSIEQKRAFEYGLGLGFVLNRHNFTIFETANIFYRPLIGILYGFIFLNFKKTKFYFFSLKGRLRGFYSKLN